MAQESVTAASDDATKALAMLGREMLAEADAGGLPQAAAAAPAQGGGEGGEIITLAMGDMIGDSNNEVVLFNDSGLKALAIATDASLLAQGATDHHVTAAGEDVSGFRYMSFDNGVTLYYQDGLDVLVRSEHHA